MKKLFLSLSLLFLAHPVGAQKLSQTGRVYQEVFETAVTVQYDRPVARGRTLFGELVSWDEIWTPGANRATWIEFSRPVTLEGREVEAGRYGIWFVPHASGEWEVSLVSEWDTHHGEYPEASEVVRFTARAGESSHMETLAFYFPEVGPVHALLRFHWGPTTLPLRIQVEDVR